MTYSEVNYQQIGKNSFNSRNNLFALHRFKTTMSMKIVGSIAELQKCVAEAKAAGKQVGFVTTMGALHNGHVSLVKMSVEENGFNVVSIFVNPTQFNDKNDLLKYPRMLTEDSQLLEATGCDLIFAPSEDEMYPEPDTRVFEFGTLSTVMEGQFRPGHFNGVAQVVSKLFNAVKPDNAYFGEKDFQQLAIIRQMVRDLDLPVNVHACPIVREKDGLAMSSRNLRLTKEQRAEAPTIQKVLRKSADMIASHNVAAVKQYVIDSLNQNEVFDVEYFDIVDGDTLQSVASWDDSSFIVGCIAVYCGEIRLIDIITYKSN